MRMIVVKVRTSLKELSVSLLGDAAGSTRAVENLQQLNPHVDFKKIEPGTILLVPETSGAPAGDTVPVGGEAFGAMRDELTAAVTAASARVRTGYDALAGQRADVTAALKLAAVRKAIEADPDLKAQVDASADVFKQDQAASKAADAELKAMQAEASAELDVLAKLLG